MGQNGQFNGQNGQYNTQKFQRSTFSFYGHSKTTSIDCLVYGYLASVIGAPWKTCDLREILLKPEHKILINFVDDMSTKLFPEVPKPSTTFNKHLSSQEQSQKSKIIKNSVNAALVIAIMTFFV